MPAPGEAADSAAAAAQHLQQTGLSRLAATVARLRQQVQNAHNAAGGRALIELATGVLVERLHCGPREAARQLKSLADNAGVTLLELSADIVNQSAQDQLSEIAEMLLAPQPGSAPGPTTTADPGGLRRAEGAALDTGDTQAVAESLLQYALAPLDAMAVAVWAAGADGSLRLAGSAGFPPAEAARWHYVPPTVATLARRALTQRRILWAPTLSGTHLPSIGGQATPTGGRVVAPAGVGGRQLGALEICWADPLEEQPPQIQRQVEALAELCAHTLDTTDPHPADIAASGLVELADGLWNPAMVLRAHLDPDGRTIDFDIRHLNDHAVDPAGRTRSSLVGSRLLETYPMAAEPGGVFDKLEHVHTTGEPFRARALPLTSLVGQVALATTTDLSITRHGNEVLLAWRTPDAATQLSELLQHAQRLGRIGAFEEDLRTGRTVWSRELFELCALAPDDAPIPLNQLPQHAQPEDATALGRFLRTLLHHHRPASTAFRLQRADGTSRHVRVVAEPVLDGRGDLVTVRGAVQDVSAQHWTEVALAATRDQLAHTEQQAAEHNRLALQLQQAIMPPTTGLIEAPGLRIAVRYRPAEKEHLVGGDWYDIVTLPTKQVLLTIGDIAGHGIQAATAMVVLRNALRGLAATGAGPAAMLGWLNTVAHYLTDPITATTVCALYDPDTRILRWARAGHLPPILVRDARATSLPAITGVLLGAIAEAEYEEGELRLEAGDSLLLYTDGLVERRDRSMQHSIDDLLTASALRSSATLDARLDYLLTHSNADTDDDTCVIGIEVG